MFFSFDGLDGVGKSTQIDLFCQWLQTQGHDPVVCRDPGSTPLGEEIREILLRVDPSRAIGRRSEMLLYMAARAQLVDEVIRPAVAAGQVVVSDRFLLANVVYQGHAGGLDIEQLWQIGGVATDGIRPDCTFLLDMEPDAAAARLNRELDRMEQEGPEFRRRIRDGFLHEAARDASIHVLDATAPAEQIAAEVRQLATPLMSNQAD